MLEKSKTLLTEYIINNVKENHMIILAGPSASGKTATCLYLQEHYGIKKVVTHTTRSKREGEEEGVDYHFVDDDTFNNMVKNDEFIEHIHYNGNQYGTSKKEVKLDKCCTLEFEGAKTYYSLHDKNIVIFYLYCDECTRRERMLSRGDEKKNVEERIDNDHKAFKLDDEIKKIFDFEIDTSKYSLEKTSQIIVEKYYQILKSRGIDTTTINIKR